MTMLLDRTGKLIEKFIVIRVHIEDKKTKSQLKLLREKI